MLPKQLFNKARTWITKKAEEYRQECAGQSGLRGIPLEIGFGMKGTLEDLARQCGLNIRVTDQQVSEFLENMQKANIIERHPLGGWMAKRPKDAPPIPTPDSVKTMTLNCLKDYQS